MQRFDFPTLNKDHLHGGHNFCEKHIASAGPVFSAGGGVSSYSRPVAANRVRRDLLVKKFFGILVSRIKAKYAIFNVNFSDSRPF